MKPEIVEKNKVKIQTVLKETLISLGAIEADECVEVEIRLEGSVVAADLGFTRNCVPHELDVLFSRLVRDLSFKTQAVRAQTCLQNLSLVTVGQLCRTRRASDLLKMRNVGKKTLGSLKQALKDIGLALDEYTHIEEAGPQEMEVLKQHLLIDNLFYMDAGVYDLLHRNGYHTLQHLFPRSEFEQSLTRIQMGDYVVADFVGEIERCLRENQIPWT